MQDHQNRQSPAACVRRYVLWSILFGILFLLGCALLVVGIWYINTYDLEFKELLYTLASPLKGTGDGTMKQILSACVPPVLVLAALYSAVAVLLFKKWKFNRILRRVGALLCCVLLILSTVFSLFAFRIPGYITALMDKTTIYEDWYVDPDTVSITSDGKTKNLIYVYMESMETTYASTDVGGRQEGINYMPLMTELASKYLTFTDKESGQLGGFHTPGGTTWTMAALLATTSGIPFSFPVGENGHNSMSRRESFATGLTTLGDILEEKGYRQEFLCGSDSVFGGRKSYFTQHGNYEIFDLFTARDEYYVPYDYHDKWWGFEDHTLYEIAKDELTELAANDQPFNFTMLTVDTHHVGGHRCRLCGYRYKERIANVVSCADQQLAGFIAWCMEQDFYEDTVIIVTGDHPRMDTILIGDTEYYDRTIYNCFFGAAVEPEGKTTERIFTSFDMFPTTLAAMGFTIEGNRLGLGVNVFSAEPTLAERLGYEYLDTELQKFSEYYIKEFS